MNFSFDALRTLYIKLNQTHAKYFQDYTTQHTVNIASVMSKITLTHQHFVNKREPVA